jgi:hypothetical protein
MHRTALAAAILLTLALPAGAARPKWLPPATPAGPALNCIRLNDIRETRVRDDQTIDFYSRSGKIYRNTLANRCPSLGFEERFSYATSLSQLCSVDIITVLQQTGGQLTRGASCGLGSFQPVTIAGPQGR